MLPFRVCISLMFDDGYKFNNTPQSLQPHTTAVHCSREQTFFKREIERIRLEVFTIAIHLLLHSVLDLIKPVWIVGKERPRYLASTRHRSTPFPALCDTNVKFLVIREVYAFCVQMEKLKQKKCQFVPALLCGFVVEGDLKVNFFWLNRCPTKVICWNMFLFWSLLRLLLRSLLIVFFLFSKQNKSEFSVAPDTQKDLLCFIMLHRYLGALKRKHFLWLLLHTHRRRDSRGD